MILRANIYCKKAGCPSSESLLAFRTLGLSEQQALWVETHLDECEFCGAELQLLSEHAPPEDEECELVEMPSSLRCLAQSLLTPDWLHIESLAETTHERERLTLTDA